MTGQPGSSQPINGTEIVSLESPIDSMFLIHKALRDAAASLEESIRRFEFGDSLQIIQQDFMKWAAGLMFHADQEDQHIMRLLVDSLPARDGQKEHAEINDRLEAVVSVFSEEIGKTKVIARTQRHLYGAVVAARIAQDDHLESEEAFILPVIRERFDETGQLGLIQHLLIDNEAADQLWVINWLTAHLSNGEQQLLDELERDINTLVSAAK